MNTNEYMNQYMSKRYLRRREFYIIYLGGKCVRCGSIDNLNFDHIDASNKSFDISKALASMAEDRLKSEIDKCQLLCVDCHKKKSIEFRDIRFVEHGGGISGKRNCSCELCRSRKREYMKCYRSS